MLWKQNMGTTTTAATTPTPTSTTTISEKYYLTMPCTYNFLSLQRLTYITLSYPLIFLPLFKL
jgi:hypothetical protein